MRILNFEDNVYKHMDVKKAISMAGNHQVDWVGNVEDGMIQIREAALEKKPYDLIVTDMHFPLSAGGEDSFAAGEAVIEELQKRRLCIPVIVCSSMNMNIPGAYGSVWYSTISDWDMELAQMIRDLWDR